MVVLMIAGLNEHAVPDASAITHLIWPPPFPNQGNLETHFNKSIWLAVDLRYTSTLKTVHASRELVVTVLFAT